MIIGQIFQNPILSVIWVINLVVLFLTLIRHGNKQGFGSWVLKCVDVSPSDGYIWFHTEDRPDDPEDVDYSKAVLASYPTRTIIVILVVHLGLMIYITIGGDISYQVFGLVYDIGGGWILIAERIRSGPYLTADIQGNAKGFLESIWGFSLLGTGFLIQIISLF